MLVHDLRLFNKKNSIFYLIGPLFIGLVYDAKWPLYVISDVAPYTTLIG